MDVKAAPENYARVTGVPGLDMGPVRESAAYLMSCGGLRVPHDGGEGPAHGGRLWG